MAIIDVRTVVLIYVATTLVCASIIFFIWLQNRRHFRGMSFWFASFLVQIFGFIFLALRGHIPDWISYVLSNTLIISGMLLLLTGLGIFFETHTARYRNLLYLALFAAIQYYFSFYHNSLTLRNLNISFGSFIFCSQNTWLLLRRIAPEKRTYTKTTGVIFLLLSAVSVIRFICAALFQRNNDFLNTSTSIDPFFLITYQILYVALTISLLYIVIGRLHYEVGADAETTIRRREACLTAIIENLPGQVWLKDEQGYFLAVNRSFAALYGYDKPDQLTGKCDTDICPAALAEEYRLTDITVMKSRMAKNFECPTQTSDGVHWHETFKAPIFDSDSHVIGTAGYTREITERKKIEHDLIAAKERAEENEKKIKTGLDEKEMLLRELYHRTKNNMQVIRSMMMLHASASKSEAVSEFSREIEQKILTMSLVHQKLYQSKDLSHIHLHEYIQELTGLIVRSYLADPDKVALSFKLEPVTVVIDIAIPCGLIVNELLTNVFKYAFPDKRKGEVRIALTRGSDGLIDVQLSDNGVGLSPSFDLRMHKSLGILTVFELVEKQLKGTIHYRSGNGLSYYIQFNENLYDARI